MKITRATGLGSVSAAALLGLAGVAWACTPSPGVLVVGPPVASPGAAVGVNGKAMRPAAPVEIRWDGPAGPVLGVVTTDAEGAFSTSVTVPQARPGSHVVVASTPAGLARAEFHVVSAGERPWSALSGDGGGSGAPAGPALVAGLAAAGIAAGGLAAAGGARRARARARNGGRT